jgi:hypothetical protein
MTTTTTTIRRSGVMLVLAAAVLAPALSTASAAQAEGSPAVVASGHCTGGGTWKLKAKHDNARIAIEFEVDPNVAGQLWRVHVTDNNANVFLGNRRTLAPSGSFTVRPTTRNRTGVDVIRAHATRGVRSCAGSVRL